MYYGLQIASLYVEAKGGEGPCYLPSRNPSVNGCPTKASSDDVIELLESAKETNETVADVIIKRQDTEARDKTEQVSSQNQCRNGYKTKNISRPKAI